MIQDFNTEEGSLPTFIKMARRVYDHFSEQAQWTRKLLRQDAATPEGQEQIQRIEAQREWAAEVLRELEKEQLENAELIAAHSSKEKGNQ